jgi:glycosyltransferase involved in cell wall biosynthesis
MVMIVACTPTKNRRWSWEFSKMCMLMQKVKPDKWIVVDNSSCPAYDWSVSQDVPFVEYHRVYDQHTIGALRNRCLDLALAAGADTIVFWDDNDYYPPERISSGLEALQSNPDADIAASSHMYVLLTKENVFMEVGPFGPKHGTAATYTIRRRYAETHRFPDKSRGEEMGFTNVWTANMVQVPAEKSIVVMGHSRNTVNKSMIYKNPQVFQGKVINADNGKMIVRSRWPLQWDLFRSTFVDGEYARLRESSPESLNHLVTDPTPHTGDTGVSGERRA